MSFPSATTSTVSHPTLTLLSLVARRLRGALGSSLVQKSGLSVLDQAVVSGTSFATSVLLARCVTRDELGVYYLALSVYYFVRGIQEQVVCAPYMIYCGRKRESELAEYAGSALIHQCVVVLAMLVTLVVALATGFASPAVQTALWLLLLAAPPLLIREFVRQMSFAHLDLKRAIVLDVAAAVLQLGAMIALASAGRLTVSTTLAAFAVCSGIPTIGWLATRRQPMVGKFTAALRDWWYNWVFARWALASHLLASTTPYVMPWVVAATHGAAETGMLGACTTLVGLSNTFLQGLCNFLSPRAAQAFARGGLSELRSVLLHTAALFGATLGALAVVGFVLGEQIAVWVFGPQFAGAGLIIGILSLSVLANSFGVTAGNGLWAMERPSANFVADLFSLGVVVVATVALVPLLGPLGAALATLSGTSTDALVRLWILRQTMREFSAGGCAAGAR
jgi:O-antigen/teichoic acid export membrane protein